MFIKQADVHGYFVCTVSLMCKKKREKYKVLSCFLMGLKGEGINRSEGKRKRSQDQEGGKGLVAALIFHCLALCLKFPRFCFWRSSSYGSLQQEKHNLVACSRVTASRTAQSGVMAKPSSRIQTSALQTGANLIATAHPPRQAEKCPCIWD